MWRKHQFVFHVCSGAPSIINEYSQMNDFIIYQQSNLVNGLFSL